MRKKRIAINRRGNLHSELGILLVNRRKAIELCIDVVAVEYYFFVVTTDRIWMMPMQGMGPVDNGTKDSHAQNIIFRRGRDNQRSKNECEKRNSETCLCMVSCSDDMVEMVCTFSSVYHYYYLLI